MSKIVRVDKGDYRVSVGQAGTITLDTGYQIGEVVVTGNLRVLGTSTVVESTSLVVKDNIIIINDGETGAGISLITAGLQIDRGSEPDVTFLFDENINHYDPVSSTTVEGTFVLRSTNGSTQGLRVNSINTAGLDLALINQGLGKVTVIGTANYERQALDYTNWDPTLGIDTPLKNGPILLQDDDDVLPNTRAMADYIESQLYWFDDYKIREGDTRVDVFDGITRSVWRHNDDLPSTTSKITFTVDGTIKTQIDSTGINIDNVRITGDTITDISSSNNLVLTATTNNITVDAILNLNDQTTDPIVTAGTNKLYSKEISGPGDTGLYFVNTRDSNELVSKKRALLFSMLF